MTMDAVKELDAMKTALTALEPLTDDGRLRALGWLADALGVNPAWSVSVRQPASLGQDAVKHAGDINGVTADIAQMTPKQFMALKRPVTDVERIACLAYYLTHARATLHFKTSDLTALNIEAAGLRFSNAAQASNNAMNQNGYLAQAGKGSRQITPRGEAVVEAMPDREAVNAALADFPKRGRRSGRKPGRAAKAK
jgi:hypothetical protein